jgi:hypothetical protein
VSAVPRRGPPAGATGAACAGWQVARRAPAAVRRLAGWPRGRGERSRIRVERDLTRARKKSGAFDIDPFGLAPVHGMRGATSPACGVHHVARATALHNPRPSARTNCRSARVQALSPPAFIINSAPRCPESSRSNQPGREDAARSLVPQRVGSTTLPELPRYTTHALAHAPTRQLCAGKRYPPRLHHQSRPSLPASRPAQATTAVTTMLQCRSQSLRVEKLELAQHCMSLDCHEKDRSIRLDLISDSIYIVTRPGHLGTGIPLSRELR